MYQQITLIGNLGSDPELRHTASGVPVCSFRLAVNKQWHAQDGDQKEKVTWFRVTAWQKLAEVVHAHLSKGRRVLVVGEVESPQAYVSKTGELAATNEVTARTIRFLDAHGGDEQSLDDAGTADSVMSSPARQGARRTAIDIPF
ncbi:MAG: single-stranded DNA-binding protein [Caldilineaceae bacterium]|nr:single-stranded DNA-binding protein [Caldilineaceae bacterium]